MHEQPEADRPLVDELREFRRDVPDDHDPDPVPQRHARQQDRLHVRRVPVVVERLRPRRAVLGAGEPVQLDQLQPDLQRPAQHDRGRHSAVHAVLPERPGLAHRRRLAGQHADGDDQLRDVRRRLVRVLDQLDEHALGRPAEPDVVRAQLLPANLRGHRRPEQHADGGRGPDRTRADAILPHVPGGALGRLGRHLVPEQRAASRPEFHRRARWR